MQFYGTLGGRIGQPVQGTEERGAEQKEWNQMLGLNNKPVKMIKIFPMTLKCAGLDLIQMFILKLPFSVASLKYPSPWVPDLTKYVVGSWLQSSCATAMWSMWAQLKCEVIVITACYYWTLLLSFQEFILPRVFDSELPKQHKKTAIRKMRERGRMYSWWTKCSNVNSVMTMLIGRKKLEKRNKCVSYSLTVHHSICLIA